MSVTCPKVKLPFLEDERSMPSVGKDPPGQRIMMRVTRPAVALRLYRDRAIEP